MTPHHAINTPLSHPPRLRFSDDMPAEDSSADISDAWHEETNESAEVTAYFRHVPDEHGGICADLIGLRVSTGISLDLFTVAGATSFMGFEAVNRIENVQTQEIADGVAS